MADTVLVNVDDLSDKTQAAVQEAAVGATWVGPAIATYLNPRYLLVPTDRGLVSATERLFLPTKASIGEYSTGPPRVERQTHPYGVVSFFVQIPTHAGPYIFTTDDEELIGDIMGWLHEGSERTDARQREVSGPTDSVSIWATQVPPLELFDLPPDARNVLQALDRTELVTTLAEPLEGPALRLATDWVERTIHHHSRRVHLVDLFNEVLVEYMAQGVITYGDVTTIMGHLQLTGLARSRSGFGLGASAIFALTSNPRFESEDPGLGQLWRELENASAELLVWSSVALLRFVETGLIPRDRT